METDAKYKKAIESFKKTSRKVFSPSLEFQEKEDFISFYVEYGKRGTNYALTAEYCCRCSVAIIQGPKTTTLDRLAEVLEEDYNICDVFVRNEP